jgi:NDP-sugar pyrophosphorylase family protein
MRPITGEHSKALLPLGNSTILDQIIDSIPRDIPVIVTCNEAFVDDFEAWFEKQERPQVQLYREHIGRIENSLGTIGSLENLIKEWKLKDDLLVLASDNILPGKGSLQPFIDAFNTWNIHIALEEEYRTEELRKHGVVKMMGGSRSRVESFIEKPTEDPFPGMMPHLVSLLCYIFPKRLLPCVARGFVEGMGIPGRKPRGGDFIQHMVELNEPVTAFRYYSQWIRITSPEDYLKEQKRIEGVA